MQTLIDNGANIHARDNKSTPPLYIHASRNYPELIKILLGRGSPINARDNNQATVLHFVKDPETARLLHGKGADVIAVNAYGSSVLHYALLRKSGEMIQFFLEIALHL